MGVLWRTEWVLFLILLAAYKSAVFSRNFDDDNDVVRLDNVRSYNSVYHAEVPLSPTEVESIDIEELETLVTHLFGALGAQNEALSNAKADFENSMSEQDSDLRTTKDTLKLESTCREDMYMLAEEMEFVYRGIREVRLATVNVEKSAWGKELIMKALTELASRNHKGGSDGNTVDSSNSLQLLKLLPPLPPFPPANAPAWRLVAWRLSRARHDAASERLRLNASRAEAAREVVEVHRKVVNIYDSLAVGTAIAKNAKKKGTVHVQRSLLQKEEGVQAKAKDTVAGTSTLVASPVTLEIPQEYSKSKSTTAAARGKRRWQQLRYSRRQKNEYQAQSNSALGVIAKLESEVAKLLERKRTIAQKAQERNELKQEQRQQLQAPSPWLESSPVVPRNNVVGFMAADKWAVVVGGGWGWGGGWFGGDSVGDLNNLIMSYNNGIDSDVLKQEVIGNSSGGNGLAADVLATIIVLAVVLVFYLFLETNEKYQISKSLSPLLLSDDIISASSAISSSSEHTERITSPRSVAQEGKGENCTTVVIVNSDNPDHITGAARSIRCPNNTYFTASSSSYRKRNSAAPSSFSPQTSPFVLILRLITVGASPRALMGVCCILAAFSLLEGGDPLLSMTPLTTEFSGFISVEDNSGRQQNKEIGDKRFKLQNITSKSGDGGETYVRELTQWSPETIKEHILLLPSSPRLASSLSALWEAASFCDHGHRGYDSSSSSNTGSKTMKNRHGDNNNNGTTKESNKIHAGDYHDQNGGGESKNHGAAKRGVEGIKGNKWWKCYFSRTSSRGRCLLAYPGVRRSLRAQVVFLVGFYGAASASLMVAVFLLKAAKLASSSSSSSVNEIDGNNYIGGGGVGNDDEEGGTNGVDGDNNMRIIFAFLSSILMSPSPSSSASFSSIISPAVAASRGLLLVSWCRSLRPARSVFLGLLFAVVACLVSAGVLYLIFPDNTGIQHITPRSSFSGDVGSVINRGDGNGGSGSVKHSPQGGGSDSSSGWWFWWNDGVVPCVCYLILASSIATSTMLTASYYTALEVLLAPPPPPLTPSSVKMHLSLKSSSSSNQSRGKEDRNDDLLPPSYELKRTITGNTPKINSVGKSNLSPLPTESSVSWPPRKSSTLNLFNTGWTATDTVSLKQICGDFAQIKNHKERHRSLVEDDEISRAVLYEDDKKFDENHDTHSQSVHKWNTNYICLSSADGYSVNGIVGNDDFSSTVRSMWSKRSSSADDAEVMPTGLRAKNKQFRYTDRGRNGTLGWR